MMRFHFLGRRPLAGGAAAAVMFVILTVALASAAVPDDVSAMLGPLAENGIMFQPTASGQLDPASQAKASTTFVAEAAMLFGAAPQSDVYNGRLTVTGAHQAGPDSPLTIENRDVVAVRLRGLEQYPMGARVPAKGLVHTELVVFFDAATGEFLLATTSQ